MYKDIFCYMIIITLLTSWFGNCQGIINYTSDENYFFGIWNEPSNSTNSLNSPSHVIRSQNELIVSDSENGRIMILNYDDWSDNNIVDLKYSNGSLIQTVFETIFVNGSYYSIIDTGLVVQYNTSGIVETFLQIPDNTTFNNFDYMHLGNEDTNLNSSNIIVRFPIALSNGTYMATYSAHQIVENNLSSPQLDLVSPEMEFSYYDGLPSILIINQGDTIGHLAVKSFTSINGFVQSIESTGVELPPNGVGLQQYIDFGESWAFILNGLLLSRKTSNVTGKENIVLGQELEFSDYLDQLSTDRILSFFSSIYYDAENQFLIVTVTENHVLFRLNLLENQYSNSSSISSGKPENGSSYYDILVLIIIGVLVLTFIGYIIRLSKRKKANLDKT